MPAMCRECGKPIDFVTTVHGKKMPVDRYMIYCKRDKYGEIIAITPQGETVRVSKCGEGEPEAMQACLPHFGTCPVRLAEEERKAKLRAREAMRKREEQEAAKQKQKPAPPPYEQLSLI